MKIAVYGIALNEAKFVARCVESAQDADIVVIGDTGSTDDTVVRAQRLGVVLHDIRIKPWRQDSARNAVLALLPDWVDVAVSIDLDEVLQDGWREEIERVWTPGTTRLSYRYDWGHGSEFQYDRIHARHGYRWKHACHEAPYPDPRIQEVWARTDKVLMVHKPDETKDRSWYLDTLRMAVAEEPDHCRNVFYLARELHWSGQHDEAITMCDRYLAMPSATWAAERDYAGRIRGRSLAALGEWREAERVLWDNAMDHASREAWCEVAQLFHNRGDWDACWKTATNALGVVDRPFNYTDDPSAWGSLPHDLASIAAWNLGWPIEAAKHVAKALELASDTDRPRIMANAQLMVAVYGKAA